MLLHDIISYIIDMISCNFICTAVNNYYYNDIVMLLVHGIMNGKIINALNVHLVVNNICLQLGVEKARRFILANE